MAVAAAKPTLSLSTSWCSSRHTDGYAMVQEMAGLGFGHIELSHGIRITLVPGILRAVEEGLVKIGSTHNFCPLPMGVNHAAPNLFEPSALGFENREGFVELPLDADYPGFIAGLPADAPAGYWHDTGHADLKQTMGLLDHRAHLEAMAPRLIGFHLHDVNAAGRDHQAVGDGNIDFAMVSRFWRPEHLLVLELSPRLPVEAVVSSKVKIEALM